MNALPTMSKSWLYDTLIELVKSNPVLYDTSHSDFRNLFLKNKLWEEIGEKIELSGEETKTKWKNARDSYSKYLKATRITGDQKYAKTYSRYSKWQWATSMEFLNEFMTPSETTTMKTVKEIVPEPSYITEFKQNKRIQFNKDISFHSNSQSKRKKPIQEPEENEASNTTSIETYKLTPTEHILLGYAKTIETFSMRRQIITKNKIANIVMEAELEEALDKEGGGCSTNEPSIQNHDQPVNHEKDPLSFLKQTQDVEEDIMEIKHEPDSP